MPVVELMPVGTASPCAWVAASTSCELRAGLDAGGHHRGVDLDRAHLREVEQQRVVGHREAGDLVPAAADRDHQPVLAGEVDRRHHVGGGARPHHQAGPAVVHRVPDRARLVVAGLAGPDDLAAQAPGKGGGGRVRNRLHASVEALQCDRHSDLLLWPWPSASPTAGRIDQCRRPGNAAVCVEPVQREARDCFGIVPAREVSWRGRPRGGARRRPRPPAWPRRGR